MILVTCAISSIVTERAATRIKLAILKDENPEDEERSRKRSNTLISIANPLTASALVDFAVLMRNPMRKNGEMYALHVRNDNSPGSRAIGRNSLDVAEQAAASVDMKLNTIERYDLNFVTGLVNTIEERDISEVIIGLHRKTTVVDSFFGSKIEQLLKATNKMIVITRCFIPVSTVTRIVVYVPEKSQFETGFRQWVMATANLTAQVGCRVIFCCHPETRTYIRSVLKCEKYDIRHEYRDVEEWDDFLPLANRILDDDLFIVVNSRRASVSFNSSMDELPGFLQKYFSRNNLVVLYPGQFGDEAPVSSMMDPLASDVVATPSSLWVTLAGYYRRLILFRKRFTQRNRHKKIDL